MKHLTNKIMKNNLDKTNFEITQKLEQQEREKYTKRYNNLNYVDFSNPNADKISSASTTTIKQETLEEAFYKTYFGNKISFNSDIGKAFELGAKWQQEKMYSEEEVKNIMAETWIRCVGNDGNDFKELRDKILEQFKNK